jgi:hypothetical protein
MKVIKQKRICTCKLNASSECHVFGILKESVGGQKFEHSELFIGLCLDHKCSLFNDNLVSDDIMAIE